MSYIPALRWHVLTPIYDLVMRTVMPEAKFRARLLSALDLRDGQRVLDVGCGTGSFCALLEQHEGVEVHGADIDPRVLERAQRKSQRSRFAAAPAHALPFDDGSFDRVTSTLLLHHLTSTEKRAALLEWRRVLRPGGQMCVLDWDRPRGWFAKLSFTSVRLVDGFARTRDHAEGKVGRLLTDAGLSVRDVEQQRTPFGTLAVWTAS